MKKETLELKHLNPYLPHSLKVKHIDLEENTEQIDIVETLSTECVTFNSGADFYFKNSDVQIKLLLRPLSDLTKDENTNLYLDLCDELGANNIDNLLLALENENYYAIDIQKYQILEEWMFKNHFDWKFGLIEKNLAIDINTL